MADNLKILIQAILNVTKSKSEIKEQLIQLEKNVGKFSLNVNTDKLKKAIVDYEQWWIRALEQEERKREQVLLQEQKLRKSINQKTIQDEEKRHKIFIDNLKKEFDEEQRNLKTLESLDKAHYLALQENEKRNLSQKQVAEKEYGQWWQQQLKREEELDRAHYLALQEDKQRNIQNKKRLDSEYAQWWQAELKRLEQIDKAHYQAILEDQRRTAAQQRRIDQERVQQLNQQQNAISRLSSFTNIGSGITSMIGGQISTSTIQALVEGFKSIVDIEAKMAGYIQTNEKYFVSFSEGAHEITLNTERANEETHKFIQTAHDLGAEIGNVLESARLWGRMYKDVAVVQELVRQSTKLSTVDLVGLVDATKMMEAVIAQYGIQIKNVSDAQLYGNRILDAWSSVAHETMAPARDLGASFERTGKIASETGVSFDVMNGLISAGIRNTALSGENLGNMWKTVLGTIRTDKAVNELERLGVATKQVIDGNEEWRRAEDILIDMAIQVQEKNYDLTKSYQDVSRGVYQYAKLAASLNVGDIFLGAAASVNSFNKTNEYLKVQMDTIDRKASQVKTTFQGLFTSYGDDGLRQRVKDSLDYLDRFLIGLTKVSKGSYDTIETIASLAAGYWLLVRPIAAAVAAYKSLQIALTAHAIVATEATAATVALNTAAFASARASAMATGGLTILTGAIALYVSSLGEAEQKEQDLIEKKNNQLSIKEQEIGQYTRQIEFLGKIGDTYEKLTDQLKNQNVTEMQRENIVAQVKKVEEALKSTIGEQAFARMKASGITKDAIQQEITAIEKKRDTEIEATNKLIANDIEHTNQKINNAKERMRTLEEEIRTQRALISPDIDDKNYGIKRKLNEIFSINPFTFEQYKIDDEYKKKEKELVEQEKIIKESVNRISELKASEQTLYDSVVDTQFEGVSGKKTSTGKLSLEERKKMFDSRMSNFRHLINMEADGYKDASGQLQRLRSIRNEFSDMSEEDLFSIDEDIYRLEQGKEFNAKGLGSSSKETPLPYDESQKFQIDVYKNALRELDAQLKETESVMTRYKDTSEEYRIEQQKQIDITIQKQQLAVEEAKRIRGDIAELENRITRTSDQSKRNDLLSQLDQAQNNLSDLSKSWWDYQVNIEQSQKKLKESLFNFSKDWITNEKTSMELLGRSEVEVAQMVYDAWKRVSDKRTQYNQEQQDEINKNLLQAQNELKKAFMTNSEQWIQDETDRMNIFGKSELEVAEMVYAARQRMADKSWTEGRGLIALTAKEQLKADKDVYDAKKKLDDLREQENKKQEESAKKIADNLKNVIEKISDAQQDYYDGLLKAEEKRHQVTMDNLDKEMQKTQEAVDLIRKTMNRESATDDYTANLSKAQKEAQDIQNLINLYSRDNSIEGKAKTIDLQKEYAAKQDEIDKMQKDRTKQLREDNLDDILDKKKKEVDASKKAEDVKYESAKNSLENQKQAVKNYYDSIINDTSRFAQVQQNVMNGHLEELTKDMDAFKTNISSISTVIGDSISKGIIDKIDAAKQSLINFSKNPSGEPTKNYQPSNGSKQSSDNGSVYSPANDREKQIIANMKKLGQSWNDTNDAVLREQLHQAAWNNGKEIGADYNSATGAWTKNGLPLYHDGGEVGTNGSFKEWMTLKKDEIIGKLKFGELVLPDPINNIVSMVKQFSSATVSPREVSNTTTSSMRDLILNFNVSGGAEGGKSAFTTTLKELNKLGIRAGNS